jgi:hypothetical protein
MHYRITRRLLTLDDGATAYVIPLHAVAAFKHDGKSICVFTTGGESCSFEYKTPAQGDMFAQEMHDALDGALTAGAGGWRDIDMETGIAWR